jgi:hypothetical protein
MKTPQVAPLQLMAEAVGYVEAGAGNQNINLKLKAGKSDVIIDASLVDKCKSEHDVRYSDICIVVKLGFGS